MNLMSENKKPIVTINLTPLVDVSLVLVVIFMATAPMFMQSGIIVTSAAEKKTEAPQPQPTQVPKNIVIKITPNGILLNEQPVAEADLPALLQRMFVETQSQRVIINPAREVRHGQMVHIMDIAKQSGADSLVIYGKPQTENEK
jgi:biopolymer transport protein ExbD